MKPLKARPKLMNSVDWKALRDGYFRIAARCLVEHVELSQRTRGGGLIRCDQVHTRFFDTIVPEAYTARYISQRCLDQWPKRYREHIVPCKFLIVQLCRMALVRLRAGDPTETVVEHLFRYLRDALIIVYLHKDESMAIDKVARNCMPLDTPNLDEDDFDPLARLGVSDAPIEVLELDWTGFVGRAPIGAGEIRVKGHRFKARARGASEFHWTPAKT